MKRRWVHAFPGWSLAFALALLGFWLGGVEVVLAVFVLAGALGHIGRARRAASRRAAEAAAWRIALSRVAGALASGMDLSRALTVGGTGPESSDTGCAGGENDSPRLLAKASAMARMGGDAAGLIGENGNPSAEHFAVCLAVSRMLGVAPRPMLLDLAAAAAGRQQVAREAGLALASARATARLLAALPLLGVFLAELISRNSIRVLFAGPVGRGCLLLAAILEACGLLWMQQISDRAAGDLVVSVFVRRWLPRVSSRVSRLTWARALLDLALAAELLAAGSAAGASASAVVDAVGPQLKGPVGMWFLRVRRELALGAPADIAWVGSSARLPGEVLPAAMTLGRLMLDAAVDGVAPSLGLRALARQLRADVAIAELERARKAGIAVVGPLGLCFLPAFVLVSVVPVVATSFGQILR